MTISGLVSILSKINPEMVRELGELWEKEAERTYIYPKPEGKKKH
jgi:hypothetical protein